LSTTLAIAVFAVLAIWGGGSAFAAACAQPFNCFAGDDGNQASGPNGLTDWQDLAPLAPLYDPAKGSDTQFNGGAKETEPAGWDFIIGNNAPKTDLLEGWTVLDNGVLDVAFTRVQQTGDTFLAFELNQDPAGPRISSAGVPIPHRKTGDILFTYDILTTGDLSFGMCTWKGDANIGEWLRLDGTPVGGAIKECTRLDKTTSPAAEGNVNWNKTITNFLSGGSILAGRFGEGAVDLGKLAKPFLTDPCGPNGWVWMHSRSSRSVVSQPKDLIAGNPISSPTCGLAIDKKVSLSGARGTFVDAGPGNPLAAVVGDTVTYAITVQNTGSAVLTVNVDDKAYCDAGTLKGPNGEYGVADPLGGGQSRTYTCTHVLTGADPDPLTNTACTTGTATLNGVSKTFGQAPNTICDSATVDIFQPGELAGATGSKFLDSNANGAHDDGEGPLQGFVFYVDYNGNGALDAGEPAAASGSDGKWAISGIIPGTGSYSVRELADPNYNCDAPGTGDACKFTVTFAGGATAAVGEFGNAPVTTPTQPPQFSPEQQKSTPPPGQIVLGERITPGRAQLLGPTGCTARAFHARIRGVKVAKVVFTLDGHRIGTLTRKNFRNTFAVRINPRRLAFGVHRLIAKVTFQRGSATKAKTFRLTFQRCPRALRAPRFTG
jgi:hypothetical protein